jgi:membrane protease YdiL (CAAX protease family)
VPTSDAIAPTRASPLATDAAPARSRRAVAVVTLLTFALATNLQDLLARTAFHADWYRRYPFWVPEGLKTTLQVVLVVAVTLALHRRGARGTADELGLARPVVPAFTFAFLATLPLLLGLAYLARRLAPDFAPAEAFYTVVYSSFAEDLVYTGFAVRQLYRRAGWPFWLAVLGVAITFGLGHVEKGRTLAQMAGLFAFTGIGLAVFAWLFIAWGDNLWVPIAMHMLIDFWWALFGAGTNAVAGGVAPMAMTAASVVLAITMTLERRRRATLTRGTP